MSDLDMGATIAPKSDQLNADDLIAGPRTITVTRVTGNQGSPEQPVNVFFEGDNGKPYRPCKSMRRVMVAAWGVNAAEYAGRSMTLYCDPGVTFGGMKVGGIRISHMSHIEREMQMALTASRAKRANYTVKPLAAPATAPVDEDLLEGARYHANLGSEAFKAWWGILDGPSKAAVKTIMEECRRLATEADALATNEPKEEM